MEFPHAKARVRRREIAKLYAAGLPLKVISGMFGVSERVIAKARVEFGLKGRYNDVPLKRLVAFAYRDTTLTARAIAMQFDVAEDYVYDAIKLFDIPSRRAQRGQTRRVLELPSWARHAAAIGSEVVA